MYQHTSIASAALFTLAKADIATALKWWTEKPASDERSIAAYCDDKTRIEKTERGGL